MSQTLESPIASPRRLTPQDNDLPGVLALIRDAFAYMDGRVDPPSSVHRLTVGGIAQACRDGEVWCIGHPPVACIFLIPRPDCLYLGKLAVTGARRGQVLARRLVDLAEVRARALGLPALDLQSRVELTGNHRAFARLGFTVTGCTAHPGHDRPTSLTFRRIVT